MRDIHTLFLRNSTLEAFPKRHLKFIVKKKKLVRWSLSGHSLFFVAQTLRWNTVGADKHGQHMSKVFSRLIHFYETAWGCTKQRDDVKHFLVMAGPMWCKLFGSAWTTVCVWVSLSVVCVCVSVSLAELSEKSPTHCFVSRATLGSSNWPEGQTVQTSTRWQEKMTQLAFQKMPHLCFWLIHIVWKNILAKFEAVVILTASYVGSPHGYR